MTKRVVENLFSIRRFYPESFDIYQRLNLFRSPLTITKGRKREGYDRHLRGNDEDTLTNKQLQNPL